MIKSSYLVTDEWILCGYPQSDYFLYGRVYWCCFKDIMFNIRLQTCNFIKRLWYWCFPVNFGKFFKKRAHYPGEATRTCGSNLVIKSGFFIAPGNYLTG